MGVAAKAYAGLHCDGLPILFLPKPPDYSYRHEAHRREVGNVAAEKYPTPEAVLAHVEALPDPDQVSDVFDAQAFYDTTLASMQACQERFSDIVWMPSNWHADGYYMSLFEFGLGQGLTALGLYPDRMRKLFEYAAAESYLRNQVLARLYTEHDFCKLMLIGQDICGQRGPMVSLKFLEWYFSLSKTALQPLLDAGFKLVWHSDGHVLPIVDLILEAGIHGFQGFQSETGTTIDKVARRRTIRGEPLLFFSGFNVAQAVRGGAPEDVRREIEHHIEATEGGRGLFLLPCNAITPDAKMENIRAAYEYAYERLL